MSIITDCSDVAPAHSFALCRQNGAEVSPSTFVAAKSLRDVRNRVEAQSVTAVVPQTCNPVYAQLLQVGLGSAMSAFTFACCMLVLLSCLVGNPDTDQGACRTVA
jgi:hypothetical protein